MIILEVLWHWKEYLRLKRSMISFEEWIQEKIYINIEYTYKTLIKVFYKIIFLIVGYFEWKIYKYILIYKKWENYTWYKQNNNIQQCSYKKKNNQETIWIYIEKYM